MSVVVVTLLTSGIDAGPFNLYSNVDGYTAPIAVNVPKATLTIGYTLPTVPVGTTLIRAKSLGVCNNFYTVGLTPGYIGLPTTSSTTTSTTTGYVGLPTTSTTTSTTSTTSSTTSTTTTSNIPNPTFTLFSHDYAAFILLKIDNVVNGTRFNYSPGATYTAPNTCLNPMGTIDPDVGWANIPFQPSEVTCGALYTVRVYNGANCSAYTDHTIALCAN